MVQAKGIADSKEMFEDRWFGWCCAEATRELDSDFSILRSLRSQIADEFLACLGSYAPEMKARLLSALVRASHPSAAERAEQALSRDDVSLIERYEADRKMLQLHALMSGQAPKAAPAAKGRSACAKVLKPKLTALLGAPVKATASEWRFHTDVGGVQVSTLVDFGGTISAVTVSHRISGARLGSLSWAQGIGLPMVDRWASIPIDEVEHIADAIVRLCARFFEGIRAVVPGAGIDKA
jgi:hypothetical protein